MIFANESDTLLPVSPPDLVVPYTSNSPIKIKGRKKAVKDPLKPKGKPGRKKKPVVKSASIIIGPVNPFKE